jgi:hypothetical protein
VTHESIVIGWITQKLCIKDPDTNSASYMGLVLPDYLPAPTKKISYFNQNNGQWMEAVSNITGTPLTNDGVDFAGKGWKLHGWYIVSSDENLDRFVQMHFTWEGEADEIALVTVDPSQSQNCKDPRRVMMLKVEIGLARPNSAALPPPRIQYRSAAQADWAERPDPLVIPGISLGRRETNAVPGPPVGLQWNGFWATPNFNSQTIFLRAVWHKKV